MYKGKASSRMGLKPIFTPVNRIVRRKPSKKGKLHPKTPDSPSHLFPYVFMFMKAITVRVILLNSLHHISVEEKKTKLKYKSKSVDVELFYSIAYTTYLLRKKI